MILVEPIIEGNPAENHVQTNNLDQFVLCMIGFLQVISRIRARLQTARLPSKGIFYLESWYTSKYTTGELFFILSLSLSLFSLQTPTVLSYFAELLFTTFHRFHGYLYRLLFNGRG